MLKIADVIQGRNAITGQNRAPLVYTRVPRSCDSHFYPVLMGRCQSRPLFAIFAIFRSIDPKANPISWAPFVLDADPQIRVVGNSEILLIYAEYKCISLSSRVILAITATSSRYTVTFHASSEYV